MNDAQTLRSMVRDDAYHVERVLADGPSGRTELVTLDGEGPLVRKRIPAEIANTAAWAAAMEADEPLLPQIESLYSMPDELVVVYVYVPGETLEALVEKQGPMEAATAIDVIVDLCTAVSSLHERGVVHRDITPANVVVSTDGAHLVDLGIARQHRDEGHRDTTALGTWGFAAPEQYGFAQTDARSDVYSLGKLLGYLLTAARPDEDEYERVLDDPDCVDPRLANVVACATAFEPSARYQSALDLAEVLLDADEDGVPRFTPTVKVAPSRKADAPAHDDESPTLSWLDRLSLLWGGTPKSPALLVLAWIVWVILGAVSLFLVGVSISYVLHPIPIWGWPQNVMVAIMVGACVAVSLEVRRAVYEDSPYDVSLHPLLLFLLRLLLIAIIAVLLFGLLVLVCAIVAPPE